MKNTTMLLIMVIMILSVGGFVFADSKNTTSKVVLNDNPIIQGDLQKVILSQEGYNYKNVNAEAGKPIAISADSSVAGCLRAVVFSVDGKKYSKYLAKTNDVLELPALEEGTYTFSCTMGMGFGKLTVN